MSVFFMYFSMFMENKDIYTPIVHQNIRNIWTVHIQTTRSAKNLRVKKRTSGGTSDQILGCSVRACTSPRAGPGFKSPRMVKDFFTWRFWMGGLFVDASHEYVIESVTCNSRCCYKEIPSTTGSGNRQTSKGTGPFKIWHSSGRRHFIFLTLSALLRRVMFQRDSSS